MRYRVLLVICVAAASSCVSVASAASPGDLAKGKKIPAFSEVQSAVSRQFAKMPDQRPDDLITRDEVEPLLTQFQKAWLPTAEAKQILEMLPAKGEFMVDQFKTPEGRTFMRRIATYPEGYDRVDRLSRLPQGEQAVRLLIQDPRGDRMIEYMTTAKGGLEMGRMVSKAPQGEKFNARTGRIYTRTMLLARLQQIHTAVVKAAGKK
jgi:hypothetical protein